MQICGCGRHWIGEKKGGATIFFWAIPYFLEITNVGDAYLIFEKISILPKVCHKQAQQIENTFESVLAIQNTFLIFFLLGLFMQNTFVFCHMPNNCFTSVPYIPYCYANIIIVSNLYDDLHPHHPPPQPLPLLGPCWHRHHRCHCWCIVTTIATIATVAIAAPTATAAAISAATSTISAAIATAFWLIVVCPCAASALATVACPHRCHRWLLTPLPL